MSNNLRKLEKDLRAMAKRCKEIKYTRGLLLLFLLSGILSFSTLQSTEVKNVENSINQARKELNTSISSLQKTFKQVRQENNRLMKDANKELIMLMEEGDHIVKSPWSSWQFGLGKYTYNKWSGSYKGDNNKNQIYPYYGVYSRSGDLDRYIGKGNTFFYNLAKNNLGTGYLNDLTSALSIRQNRDEDISNSGFANLELLNERPLVADVNANVVPKEVSRTPQSPSINPAQPPAINIPSVNYNISVNRPGTPGTAETFNIDLGSYCNGMEECLWQDERLEGGTIADGDKYGFNDFDGDGYDDGYDGYAGYRHFNNDTPGYTASVTATTNTSAHGMTGVNASSLIYSWNINSPTRRGQWRLLNTYLDVQADTNEPLKEVNLTVNTDHEISSVNMLDSMPDSNFNSWIPGLLTALSPGYSSLSVNKKYEIYMNRPFNTQAFYVGGSRFATLDNVTGGGSINNQAKLNLVGPLTVGLEVQYDKIGDRTRSLINSGIISDRNETGMVFSNGNGGTVNRGDHISLDLGIYNWKQDDNYWGHNIIDSSSIREDTVTGGWGTAPLNISVGSGHEKVFYRNQEGYIGGKVGLILTREDGEEKTNDDNDRYKLTNSGTIDFRGDDSIGIQVYSPFSHLTDTRHFPASTEEINGNTYEVFTSSIERKIVKVDVKNESTITTTGAKSYGMKISSRVNYNESSVVNETSGVINVAGYGEDNVNNPGNSAGIAVLEDKTQTGKNFYENQWLTNLGTINGYVKPDGSIDSSVQSTSPKPIVAGDMVKNNGKIQVAGNSNSGMFLQTAFDDTFVSNGTISIKKDFVDNTDYDKISNKNIGIRIDSGVIADQQTYVVDYEPQVWGNPKGYVTYSAQGSSTQTGNPPITSDGVDTRGIISKLGTQKGINTANAHINIETGDENVGMLASGGNAQVINQGTISITDNDTTNTEKGNFGMATAVKRSFKREAGTDGVLWTSDDKISYDEPTGNADFYQIGYAENNGKININTKSKKNVGILINSADNATVDGVSGINKKGTGKTTKTSEINIETDGNIGIANFGNFTMEAGTISAKGIGSVGIYANYGHSNGTGSGASTTIIKEAPDNTKAAIKAKEGAVALYIENSSNGTNKTEVKIQNTDFTIDKGGLLFYNYSTTTTPNVYRATGTLNITGTGAKAVIKNNGLAFLLKQNTTSAPYWDVNDVLTNITSTTGNKLTLKMEDGARLFLIDAGANATVTASDVNNIKNILSSVGSKVTIDANSGNFKYVTLKGGTFNVNSDIALGDANNTFALIDYVASNVNILSNKTISNVNAITNEGERFATGDQYVIAQINPKLISEGGTAGEITVKNDGNIIVKENSADGTLVDDTIAIVTDLGTVINNGTLTNTTDNGVGILGARSSVITNSGNITVGNNGTGIYGLNKLSGNENGNITITNNGNITATGSSITAGYGIISLNTASGMTSNVTHNSGKIDTSVKEGGAGIYVLNNASTANSVINANGGEIISGKKGAGIVHVNGTTNLGGVTMQTVGENSTAVYHKDGGAVNLSGTIFKIGNNGAGVYAVNTNIVNNGSTLVQPGNGTIAYAIENGTYSTPVAGPAATLASDSVYIFARASNGGTASITNNTPISFSGESNVALYGKGAVNAINNAVIDLNSTNNTSVSLGKGLQNVGILMTGDGGNALNTNLIKVGISDKNSDRYSIGMAAEGTNINLENNSTITVAGNRSIGMYGSGAGVTVKNNGTIILDASSASSSDRVTGMTGIYVANGATGYNYGTIKTAGDYTTNPYVKGITGIVIKDATFVNYSNVEINANESAGVYIKNGVIKNYGNMTITGDNSKGVILEGTNTTTDGQSIDVSNGDVINGSHPFSGVTGRITAPSKYVSNITYDPSNSLGSVVINGDPDTGLVNGVTVDGIERQIHEVSADVDAGGRNYYISKLGIYIDTLGRTNAIRGLNNLFNNPGTPARNLQDKINVMFGAELADKTREKVIRVPAKILAKLRNDYPNFELGSSSFSSGAYHWVGSLDIGNPDDQNDDTFVMAKVPYTNYAKKGDTNIYNFLDGLEQRYSENEIDSPEKLYFNKLNSIGDGEARLWAQAVDEALGRQYINARQRIYVTSMTLDKEFDGLRDWKNFSKNANKITSFGIRDEYKTNSAQVHNYKNNAYGVAYLNEIETIKMGTSSGWYAGAVHNTFKLKDIGGSQEAVLMLKVGMYKSNSFGNSKNNIWTVSGEGFVSQSEMKRKFLNVDTIYEAKGKYNSYGVALKNELMKNIRLSERFTFTPYGVLKMEYGHHSKIKEKSGVLRLEIAGNDYFSVKPETGVSLTYKQPMAVKTTFVASLGLGYEAELGKITKGETRFKVGHTNAGTYVFEGEKDNKKGNFKTDLNIGIDNQRFGVTLNAGYDTKGKNARGGIGFKVIF